MTYSGHLRPSGISRWLQSVVARPIFNKLVGEHLQEGKRLAESRARRTRVHRTGGRGKEA